MPSHYPVPARNRANAKRMRHVMTDAELKLWNELRAHRLDGLGFRRQFPIRNFIVDFACPEHRLVVEVDGIQHGDESTQQADLDRTALLEEDGWIVLRFWNDEVMRNIDGVCDHILAVIREKQERKNDK
jgi:very-short-patch-repair endonuclease